MEDILSEIKKARELKGMSQSDVAAQLDIGLRQYQNIEAGKFPKYKTAQIRQLDEILGLSVYEKIYEQNIHTTITNTVAQSSFLEKRRTAKNTTKTFMVPFVPIKAQAGYVRAIDQTRFIDTMEEYALPPGVDPTGAIWRYWEIEGESMEPSFRGGDIILTSQVHHMDWENIRNFYLYIIVTDDRVLFKRIYAKNQLEWVLISENEDIYPQQLLPVEYIKEVWVYRRSIVMKGPPIKQYEIKV